MASPVAAIGGRLLGSSDDMSLALILIRSREAMYIFNSSDGNPMLLDSAEELRGLYRELRRFLESSRSHETFPATTTGDPAPYSEYLGGLRVEKNLGPIQLRISADRWLELCGSPEDLLHLINAFRALSDGSHHRWYTSPVSLIIEADHGYISREN
jgi:hypothetical protein